MGLQTKSYVIPNTDSPDSAESAESDKSVFKFNGNSSIFRCLQQVALRTLTSSYFLYSLSTSNSEQQGLCGSMSECPTIKDFRVTFIQFTKQQFQRTLLGLRSCVTRRLAVNGKPSYIRHTEGMAVMFLQCAPTCASGRPRSIAPSVGINSDTRATPIERAVVAINVRHSLCATRTVCGAMHDNQSYCCHRM